MSRALFAALLFSTGAAGLEAQVVDTTRADSLARADTTDYTAQFLKSQQDAKRLIPTAPRIGAGTLLPPGSRIVFDRDSILWHNAETVSDLLTRVPGVYLLRGGWAGRPELPAFQAHGATSVSYVLDGIPYQPLGQDSVMVDPSLLPLSFIDRIEVERLPGHLKVWMFTRRNDRATPFSRIAIASGDLSIARYQGQLEKRSTRGPGVLLAFDHFEVPAQQGERGTYGNTQAWVRLEYLRNEHAGAELSWFRNSPEREPVLSAGTSGDTLSRARAGTRHDLTARFFLAPGRDGLGPRIDLLASRSGWTDEIEKDSTLVITDVLDPQGNVTGQDTSYQIDKHRRRMTQLGAVAGYRLPAASLAAAFFWRSAWTPIELRAQGALTPLSRLTVSAEAVYLRHEASRTSKWLVARGGLALPLGFSAQASWRRGSEVVAPALLADTAQTIDDRGVSLSWRSSFAELEGSFTTNSGFQPLGYAQYPELVRLAPSGRTDWLSVSGRLAPRQWLSLSGWYSTPRVARPEGQPPSHALAHATIQSKFLPTFKSGIFNLKLQVTLERWGAAVLGRDSADTQVTLPAATSYRGYIGLQIGRFTAYYDRYNMQGGEFGYVPRLLIPKYVSTFGVRWEFAD